MKLTDVKFKIIGGKPHIVTTNKRGKVTARVDCSKEFNDAVIKSFNDVWLDHGGKSYLCAIREASKEQLATRTLKDKCDGIKRAHGSSHSGAAASIWLQAQLMRMYTGYDSKEIQMMRNYIKDEGRRR